LFEPKAEEILSEKKRGGLVIRENLEKEGYKEWTKAWIGEERTSSNERLLGGGRGERVVSLEKQQDQWSCRNKKQEEERIEIHVRSRSRAPRSRSRFHRIDMRLFGGRRQGESEGGLANHSCPVITGKKVVKRRGSKASAFSRREGNKLSGEIRASSIDSPYKKADTFGKRRDKSRGSQNCWKVHGKARKRRQVRGKEGGNVGEEMGLA